MIADHSTAGMAPPATGRIAVPDHLLHKLRKAAAQNICYAGRNALKDWDFDTPQDWAELQAGVAYMRDAIAAFDDVQREARDPGQGIDARLLAVIAQEAAAALSWTLEDAPSRATDPAKADGLIDDIRTVGELVALAREAGATD